MTADFRLALTTAGGSSLVFVERELPEHIRFGGSQKLVVHELLGGGRVVEALGAQPQRLEWSGLFLGPSALDRAMVLDNLRQSGRTLLLQCHRLRYSVVIADLVCDFQRYFQLPYTLTLEVVAGTALMPPDQATDALQQATTAAASAQAAATQLVATAPSSLLASAQAVSSQANALGAMVASLNTVAKTTSSALGALLVPVANLRRQVGTLLAATNNLVQNATTLGGLLPHNPLAQQAAGLLNQANAMNSLPVLVQLDTALGQMQGAAAGNSSGPTTVTVMPGASLYEVAAQQYGDASAWQVIATANGLNDPVVPGATAVAAQASTPLKPVTLVIPPAGSRGGGTGNG